MGADGRKNGFGSILFEDQETASLAAKELDGNYIGERYVEISVISYGGSGRPSHSLHRGPPVSQGS